MFHITIKQRGKIASRVEIEFHNFYQMVFVILRRGIVSYFFVTVIVIVTVIMISAMFIF